MCIFCEIAKLYPSRWHQDHLTSTRGLVGLVFDTTDVIAVSLSGHIVNNWLICATQLFVRSRSKYNKIVVTVKPVGIFDSMSGA